MSISEQGPFTVMTFNILQGVGMDDVEDLERTAAVIRNSGAEIVAVQEVAVHEEYGEQGERLGKLLGMHVVNGRRLGYWHAGPHPDRWFGVSLLSTRPVEAVRLYDLPVFESDRRELLEARITMDDGSALTVFVTHPTAAEPENRVRQLAEARRIVADSTGPALLMGDLNDEPEHPNIRQFAELFTDAGAGRPECGPTYPSDAPVERIDYIFAVRGLSVQAAHTVHEQVSDHCAVVARLAPEGR
jgi:endonuclease/exonuclease/phosphatase family metal-dependent hydrolase